MYCKDTSDTTPNNVGQSLRRWFIVRTEMKVYLRFTEERKEGREGGKEGKREREKRRKGRKERKRTMERRRNLGRSILETLLISIMSI